MLTETRFKEIMADAVAEGKKRPLTTGRGNQCTGALLRKELGRFGYSYRHFANLTGVHPTFVGKVAKGERGVSIDTLVSWAPYLGESFAADWIRCLTEEGR